MSVEARQGIAAEIAEGVQTAGSLKSLLLGRNYAFYGRVEIEAAAYSGDIPSSENADTGNGSSMNNRDRELVMADRFWETF